MSDILIKREKPPQLLLGDAESAAIATGISDGHCGEDALSQQMDQVMRLSNDGLSIINCNNRQIRLRFRNHLFRKKNT